MQTFEYFPAQVNREERPDFLDQISEICNRSLDEVRNQEANLIQSNNLLAAQELTDFKNYLLLSSVNILKEQGYSVENYDFYLSSLWAQEVNKGGGTIPHVHKNSQICGWFFTEVPEESGSVVYHDTRANKYIVELDYIQGDSILNATNSIVFDNLMAGTSLFSNYWMQHQIVGSKSEQPIRCFHFVVSHRVRACNIS